MTELFENGYDQGYEDGKKSSCDCKDNIECEYIRGLNDAWEATRKLFRMSVDDRSELFEMKSPYFDFSVQEVLNKIKEHENKQEHEEQQKQFAVGDEVYSDAFEDKGIITHITADKVSCVCIICNGSTMMKVGTNGLHKTGKHFDQIAEILAEMRGERE